MKYTLKFPVRATGSTPLITELQLREEIDGGVMRGVPQIELGKMDWEHYGKICGRLSGQNDTVMNRILVYDQRELMTIIAGFLALGLETGSSDSPSSPTPSTSG